MSCPRTGPCGSNVLKEAMPTHVQDSAEAAVTPKPKKKAEGKPEKKAKAKPKNKAGAKVTSAAKKVPKAKAQKEKAKSKACKNKQAAQEEEHAENGAGESEDEIDETASMVEGYEEEQPTDDTDAGDAAAALHKKPALRKKPAAKGLGEGLGFSAVFYQKSLRFSCCFATAQC